MFDAEEFKKIITVCRELSINPDGGVFKWWADLTDLLEEIEFLRFYKERAYDSFGPADADIDHMIKEEYERRTGNKVPLQYKDEEDESN